MKCSSRSISGKNVVVLNSKLRFIYKYSTYLKMCFTDFRSVSSMRSPGARCSCNCLTSDSDVSVGVKHEVKCVLGKYNRQSLVS